MHKPQRLLMQGQQNQLNDLPALEEFGGRVRPSMHGIVPRRATRSTAIQTDGTQPCVELVRMDFSFIKV